MPDYWVKLYHEILDDPKMATLPDRLWRRVIELFLLAGRYSRGTGVLPDTKQLAWALRISTDDLQTDLDQLTVTGIIERTETGWMVVNFQKRQAKSDVVDRVRRYRDRQQRAEYYGDGAQPMSNEDVTHLKRNVTLNGNEDVTHLKRNVTQINRLTDTDTDTDPDTDTAPAMLPESNKTEPDIKTSRENIDDEFENIGYLSKPMKPLVDAFQKATGIYPPVGGGSQSRRWHTALIDLLRMRATPEEVTLAVQGMQDKGLTISGIWSIINGVNIVRASKKRAKKRVYVDADGNPFEVME